MADAASRETAPKAHGRQQATDAESGGEPLPALRKYPMLLVMFHLLYVLARMMRIADDRHGIEYALTRRRYEMLTRVELILMACAEVICIVRELVGSVIMSILRSPVLQTRFEPQKQLF
eukprot:260130-Pleurochrysis_carterae.AAC.3